MNFISESEQGIKFGPLVSVFIITYNRKDFLRECIESILSQTYQNIEIVVANDASSDDTYSMLIEYKNNYQGKFTLITNEKNMGVTVNSNNICFCRGKYIAFMGDDDLMLPNKIARQVEYMEANCCCDILYHNVEVFDSDSNKVLYYFNNKRNKFRRGDASVLIKRGAFFCMPSVMIRRDKISDNEFDRRIPIASDYLYLVEMLVNSSGTIEYLDGVFGRYRKHGLNVTKVSDFAISQDHLNSCVIILSKYPMYYKEALYRLAFILCVMGAGRNRPIFASKLLRASLSIKFRFITLILIMANFCGLLPLLHRLRASISISERWSKNV